MREIKLRAWNGKEMIYNVFIKHQNVFQQGKDSFSSDSMLWINSGFEAVKPENVMQFTEIKDKNKNEIYEGDYCKSIGCEGIIEFDSGCFSIKIAKENEYYDIGQSIYLCDYLEIFKNTEVIGSIYENPELMVKR